jgi:hypothetical protein
MIAQANNSGYMRASQCLFASNTRINRCNRSSSMDADDIEFVFAPIFLRAIFLGTIIGTARVAIRWQKGWQRREKWKRRKFFSSSPDLQPAVSVGPCRVQSREWCVCACIHAGNYWSIYECLWSLPIDPQMRSRCAGFI